LTLPPEPKLSALLDPRSTTLDQHKQYDYRQYSGSNLNELFAVQVHFDSSFPQ
jgi:hypothetical protein